MTWELRALLLGAVGLAGCGPFIAEIEEIGRGDDYGTCDAENIDELEVLERGDTAPELYTEYLRCTADLDGDACMDACDTVCQAEIAATQELDDGFTMAFQTCGPMFLGGECCVSIMVEDFCCEGRPFLVDGSARVAPLAARADWRAACAVDVPADLADKLAAHWSRAGQQEHASVAAFSRFSLVLLHLGAPADLVMDTHAAALDEVRHATQCFGLASRFAGKNLGPGPLSVADALRDELSPEQVLRTLFHEGCVGETTASLRARVGAHEAHDPHVKLILEGIAADEASHAALAWRTVRWLLESHPELRAVLRELLDAPAPVGSTPDPEGLEHHGILGPIRCVAISRDVHVQLVQPIGRSLLADIDSASTSTVGSLA